MNTIYKLVWNAAIGSFVAASELAKGRKKTDGRKKTLAITAVMLMGGTSGAASAAEACMTADGREGSLDASGVCATRDGTPVARSDVGILAAYQAGGGVASGTNSVVIGTNASDNRSSSGGKAVSNAVIIGNNASTYSTSTGSTGAIVIGDSAFAFADASVALGQNASAGHSTTTALGAGANAVGLRTTAIGYQATAVGLGALAVGHSSNAAGVAATAVGYGAVAGGDGSIAIGGSQDAANAAQANALHSIAIGEASSTAGAGAIALGESANASSANSVAIGYGASAASSSAVALGAGSIADEANTVSVGNGTSRNRIVNMANGLNGADAVNLNQLSSVAAALGGGASIDPTTGLLDGPTYNLINGGTQTTVGDAIVQLDNAVSNAVASGVQYDDSATRQRVTLGGPNANAGVVLTNVARGSISAGSADAINGAQLFDTVSSVTAALGGGSVVKFNGTITTPSYMLDGNAVGGGVEGAFTNLDGRVIKSANDITLLTTQIGNIAASAVLYDDPATKQKVTLGGTNASGTVGFTNVANGSVDLSSTDAINGAQLFGAARSMTVALGAGSTVNLDGSITTPIYVLDGNPIQGGVEGAFANLDGRVVKNTNDIADLTKQIGNVAIGAVMYDDLAAKQKVTLGGVGAGSPVTLTNVANGNVNASSTDAINGAQLLSNANSVAVALGGGAVVNQDGSITTPSYVLDGNAIPGGVEGAFTNLDGRVIKNASDIVHLTTQIGDVAGGAVMYDDPITRQKVSLGGVGATSPVLLANVANGNINANSSDAINGAQLFGTASSITAVLGAGSVVNPDGSITMPSYVLDGSPVEGGVEGAFENLDGRVIKNTKDIADLTTQVGDVVASAVMYDDPSTKSRVTLGGPGASSPVKLTNIANGDINAISTDAINGAQLFGTASSVATALGGGSVVNPDGSITMPSYVLNGNPVAGGVEGAFANLDGRVIDNTNAIADLSTQIGDVAASAVIYDDPSAKSQITLSGAGGTLIDNLKDGLVAADSMQAVNGGQLFHLQQNFQNQFDFLNGQVSDLIGHDGIYGPRSGSGENSLEVGIGANAAGSDSTALGNGSVASGDNSTATGAGAVASGSNSTSMGADAVASVNGSTALGTSASASGENGSALGSNAKSTANNSVALGANSVADRENSVSVGSEGNERQITNVAAGANRTDAANWGQVQDTVNNVKDWANQKFHQIDRRINRMGAMGAAYGQMAFSAQGLETKNRLGVGVGNQGGQSAIAIGYSRQLRPNVNLSFGGSASSGDASVGAGLAVGW